MSKQNSIAPVDHYGCQFFDVKPKTDNDDIICPNCHADLEFFSNLNGLGTCPHCWHRFEVALT